MNDRRYIEQNFPVKEVSQESKREKAIRHGHISTLHIWWARRPLSSSRTTSYASLIPLTLNQDELIRKRNLIIKLADWDNFTDLNLFLRVKKEILASFNGSPPRVLDPFAGGGSIPLASLRLGCEVYASDYNPVAVLIEKCTLEYPYKFKHQVNNSETLVSEHSVKLVTDIKKYGSLILSKIEEELKEFFPNSYEGYRPVGYLWSRTLPCQNPSCQIDIPLVRQFWLAKSKNRKIAAYPQYSDDSVYFEIVGNKNKKFPENFDPSKGTISRSIVTCPVCNNVIDAKKTRKLFQDKKDGQMLVVKVEHKLGEKGKKYREITEEDIRIYESSLEILNVKQEELLDLWGLSPIPNELLPPKETLGFRVQRYGFLKWGDLFNTRQKLLLISLAEKIRDIYELMIKQGENKEYSKAVTTYLAFALDRLADYNSTLTRWVSKGEFIGSTFTRPALPMIWDYFELCPWSESTGDWNSAISWISKVIDNLSKIQIDPATVLQSSATNLPFEDNFFDAVFTDPPYYDNVPYAHLSDFFYVWLKRSIGHLYPDLFSTPLTPKSNEIVAYSHDKTWVEAKISFETLLSQSFKEIHRVLKPDGIATIVYAHKTTEGWETVINALLDSGLTVTASWPISTEMESRLRAQDSAALASSIYIIVRKFNRYNSILFPELKKELTSHLEVRLKKLWSQGLSGPDFFIAAIGAAMEVSGRYREIMDYDGITVRADRILDEIRNITTNYALHQILEETYSESLSPLTRFYILYRWSFGEARVPFDEARKLAQSVGVSLEQEWNKSFIKKEKEFIRVLGPHERDKIEFKDSRDLIGALHYTLYNWELGKTEELTNFLSLTGFGVKDSFYRVAQAISECLHRDSKEKKLMDGFLMNKERTKEKTKTIIKQKRIDEWTK